MKFKVSRKYIVLQYIQAILGYYPIELYKSIEYKIDT